MSKTGDLDSSLVSAASRQLYQISLILPLKCLATRSASVMVGGGARVGDLPRTQEVLHQR
jgi:hypothetical protein